jgi:NAD-dependent dihydropyrimidine dehydrogenase PreA subunit
MLPASYNETLKTFPEVSGKPAFIFKTAGDPLIEGGSTARIRRILTKKGFEVFHEYNYLMPANVFTGYDDRFSLIELDLTERIAERNASSILEGKKRLQKNGPLKRLGSFLAVFEHIGAKRLGKLSFYTTDACNLCGACVLKCPMQNIV